MIFLTFVINSHITDGNGKIVVTMAKSDQKEFISLELENDNDWEYLELHFDKVHADFLKKLKNQFPELGSLDTRLCAYIRMNLSSKEVAALMNSTLRGVESNRYRLRKTLGLDSGDNLKDFLFRLE